MISRLSAIAIDAVHPPVVADFWMAALGWQEVAGDDEVISIAAPNGSWPSIDVAAVPESKTTRNRLHLDLRTAGGGTAQELQRLVGLGARPVDVGQGADVGWYVLADPEGNEFCLLTKTAQEIRRVSQSGSVGTPPPHG